MSSPRPYPRPLTGLAGGVVAVVLTTLAASPFRDHISRAIPALLLVLPVVGAGVVGGRLAAIGTAAAGTVAFSVGFIPPVGSLRVAVPDDAVALVVFGLVAIAVGTLVALVDDRRRSAEQRTEEIKAMHGRFEALVSEREKLRQEADRLALLEEVDAQRAALLCSVSHDLRTPLALIRAVASDLRAGTDHSEAVREELLGLVCDQAERLDRIVANLLSLSRIEAGAFQPDRQAVDFDELLRDVTRRLRRLFDDDHIGIDCRLSPDLPLVDVDYVQIDQVLSNLLENAARFSPPGSTIHIAASPSPSGNERGDRVQVTVSDEGPGIDARDLGGIFEPFRTGRPAQPGTAGGFGASGAGGGVVGRGVGGGVGLALCKAIVEAHGGMIDAGNNPTGGARLTFTLPVRLG